MSRDQDLQRIFSSIGYDQLERMEAEALRQGALGLANAIDRELRRRAADVADSAENIRKFLSGEEE